MLQLSNVQLPVPKIDAIETTRSDVGKVDSTHVTFMVITTLYPPSSLREDANWYPADARISCRKDATTSDPSGPPQESLMKTCFGFDSTALATNVIETRPAISRKCLIFFPLKNQIGVAIDHALKIGRVSNGFGLPHQTCECPTRRAPNSIESVGFLSSTAISRSFCNPLNLSNASFRDFSRSANDARFGMCTPFTLAAKNVWHTRHTRSDHRATMRGCPAKIMRFW